MHLSISTQLPFSFSEPAISSPRASVSVVIPTLNEAMDLPWVLCGMHSYMDEVVIVDGRSHDHPFDVTQALTAFANTVLRSDYSDLCSGNIAFRGECLEVELESSGFEIETEPIVGAARAGLRIDEVPSIEFDGISGARPEVLRRVKYAYVNVRFPRTPTDPQSVLALVAGH